MFTSRQRKAPFFAWSLKSQLQEQDSISSGSPSNLIELVFIFGDVVETQKISQRLLEIINSLPSKNGVRVLEIGCGTGVAAREIVNRIGDGKVLAIDRSSKAIEQAINSASEISNGRLQFIQSKIEEFELPKEDQLYDIAFASRVGALDLRHPEINKKL